VGAGPWPGGRAAGGAEPQGPGAERTPFALRVVRLGAGGLIEGRRVHEPWAEDIGRVPEALWLGLKWLISMTAVPVTALLAFACLCAGASAGAASGPSCPRRTRIGGSSAPPRATRSSEAAAEREEGEVRLTM
jgi:hypothetical protein